MATGFDWYSQGIILRPARLSSIVEIKRIQGPIFNSKEEAEQHGLALCKDWIDKLHSGDEEKDRRNGFTALEGKIKKKRLLLWALLLVVLTSEGCATIRGMGEDIQSLGRAVKRTFSGG